MWLESVNWVVFVWVVAFGLPGIQWQAVVKTPIKLQVS
jgi:hypothetical protein